MGTGSDVGMIVLNWGNVKKLLADMDTVGGQSAAVKTYAQTQVFSTAAFDYDIPLTGVSVLQPLYDAMKACGDTFGDATDLFDERWESLTAAVAVSAKEFDDTDAQRAHDFLKPYLDLVDKVDKLSPQQEKVQ